MPPKPTKLVALTNDQLFELNDAAMATITRMLELGQTQDEVRRQSLARLWEARNEIVEAVNGPGGTFRQAELEAKVRAAIQSPIVLRWSVFADGAHLGYVSCLTEEEAIRAGCDEFKIADGVEVTARLLR